MRSGDPSITTKQPPVQAGTDDAAAAPAILDRAALDALAAGYSAGSHLLHALVALFRDEGRKQLAHLHDALHRGDHATATRAVHTLKSSSAALGARRLSEHCHHIEHALRTGTPAAFDTWIEDAVHAFEAALAAMHEALAGTEPPA